MPRLGTDEDVNNLSWGLHIIPTKQSKTAATLQLDTKEASKKPFSFFEQRKKFLPDATLNEIVELTENLAKQHVSLPPLKLGQLNLDACRKTLKEMERQNQLQRQSQLLAPATTATDPLAATIPGVPSVKSIDPSKSSLLLTYGASLERWITVWDARSETTSSVLKDAELMGHHRLHNLASLSASQALHFPSCHGLNLTSDAQPQHWHSREASRCGVSLAFLLHFADHVSTEADDSTRLTTRQVVEGYVLPRTSPTAARFCDSLPEALVGHPRFLVSHRWDSLFQDLVMKLIRHFQGQDPELVFVYLDIFSAKQSGKETEPGFAQLQDIIKDHVQQTLVILDRDGIVLTRAWVLWEVHCTLAAHPQLPGSVCVLGYGVHWSFVLQELALRIDFATAEGNRQSDVESIKQIINKTPDGMAAASRAVAQAVRKSAARQAKHAEKLLLTSHGRPSLFIGLRVEQAIMARVDGKLQEAEKILWGVLDYMIKGLHGEPEDLAFAVEALVDVMVASGVPEEFHRAALLCLATQERLERSLGPEHVVCLRLAHSHVWALFRSGQLQAAEQLARLNLSRQEKVCRPGHELMDSLVALATVNRALSRSEEAMANLLRAVKLGEDDLGWGRPQCATALQLLGGWCHDMERYGEAAVWLVQARASMSKIYSHDSTQWVQATLQLSTCMLKLEDVEAAEKLLMGLLTSKGQADTRPGDGAVHDSTSHEGRHTLIPPPHINHQHHKHVHGLSEDNLKKELGGQMFNVLHQLLFILVTSTHAAPSAAEQPTDMETTPDPSPDVTDNTTSASQPEQPTPPPQDAEEGQAQPETPLSAAGEGEAGSTLGSTSQRRISMQVSSSSMRASSMRLVQQQSLRMQRSCSVALLEDELEQQETCVSKAEDLQLRTMNDVLTEATIVVTRLLFLFDKERDEVLMVEGGVSFPTCGAEPSGRTLDSKPSMFRQSQSLFKRAMTDHGAARLRQSRESRSVFSAQPLQRKFKVRHRALVPLPSGSVSAEATPHAHTWTEGRGSVEQARLGLGCEEDGSLEEETSVVLNAAALGPISSSVSVNSGSKQKQTAQHEQRRHMLLNLSQALCQHAEVLQRGGDTVGAALAMQLGLTISHHLSGPGHPEAIAGVAFVIDLLVNKRRFAEAKQQLNHHMAMPAMSEQSRKSLKSQVERYMTQAAFKATVVGDCEIVREAMALGAHTSQGSNQLMVLAASHGQRDIVNALLRVDPAIAERADADTAMHPLAAAAAVGHRGIVEDLLALKRSFVDVIDAEGRTPLVHAALNGHAAVATMLIAARADVNSKYLRRYTSLIGAAICGHTKIVELLIENGANVDSVDQHGQSALFHAILCERHDIVSLLLEAGCKLNLKDHEGGTALIYATTGGRLDVATMLVSYGADLDGCDRRGMTALMHAAVKGRSEIADLLLIRQCSIRAHDVEGRTALMHAAQHGHLTICSALLVHASMQDSSQPLSLGDPDASSAIQLRVDQALMKAGVKLPTNKEVADAVTEVHRLAKLPLASSDTATCLKALEVLRLTGTMSTLVRMYACMVDAAGHNAADIAEAAGHEEVTQALHSFIKKREEIAISN